MTLLTAAAAELDGDYGRSADLTAKAIEIAERLDDARCLIWVSAAAGSAGIWGNGLPYANRAVRIAREKSLAATLPRALQARGAEAEVDWGRPAERTTALAEIPPDRTLGLRIVREGMLSTSKLTWRVDRGYWVR